MREAVFAVVALGAWVFLSLAGVAVLLALGAAAALLRIDVRRRTNQLLAAILLADAGFVGIVSLVLNYEGLFGAGVSQAPGAFEALFNSIMVILTVLPWLVLLFLTYALRSPLVRPFANAPARATITALGIAALGAAAVVIAGGPELINFDAYLYFTALVSLFALTAAVTAYQIAPPRSLARRQAAAFVLAFGTRDLAWFSVLSSTQVGQLLAAPDPFAGFLWLPLASIAFVTLLTVGVVRNQLLDLDVRLRITVRRGTIGVLLLAAVLVTASVTETFLQQYNWLAGGLVAGLMLVALHPLQRFAERVATFAVPDARPLSALSAAERAALYREQLEIAWEDGSLSRKERRLLEASRSRLGIGADEASRIENEVLARPRARARPGGA